mgnify:CR=1 FL=1
MALGSTSMDIIDTLGTAAEYEQAKEEDDLERALHLKKVVLPQLKADVAADHVVAGWNAASPAHRTLAQMAAANAFCARSSIRHGQRWHSASKPRQRRHRRGCKAL